MKRALVPVVLVLVLSFVAGASASQVAIPVPSKDYPGREPGMVIMDVYVSLRVDTRSEEWMRSAFVIVNHDNRLNLTITNSRDTWFNDTVVLNATGPVTWGEPRIPVSVPPFTTMYYTVVVHPEEVGMMIVRTAFEEYGASEEFAPRAEIQLAAIPATSIRIVTPSFGEDVEDEDFQLINPRGPPGSLIRITSKEQIAFEVEVQNLADAPAAGFQLVLMVQGGEVFATLDVEPLEPRESRTLQFPEWNPGSQFQGCYGCQTNFEFLARYTFGNVQVESSVGAFTIRSGAVTDVVPAVGRVEVNEGLVVDVRVAKAMRLGVPARVKVDVTNFGSDPVRGGRVIITLQTPGRLHYGVQGPETREYFMNLQPGEKEAFTFEFVPRVTGRWGVDQTVTSRNGGQSGYGGDGFSVPGPVRIGVDSFAPLIGRIGERIPVDVRVTTSATLENAQLRLASQSTQGMYDPGRDGAASLSGTVREGISSRIVRADPEYASLGTLRAGDAVNVTFTVTSSGSGSYQGWPFVLANGFAYTSEMSYGGPMDPTWGGNPMFQVAVQPRPVQLSWAIFPFTLVVALMVGAWTLRTRFVR